MHLFILIRKGKINSENELNTTLVYGAVWPITLLVTYIMIYTGMRNLDGSQSLLKLLQMITHLGEVNFRIICSSSKHYRGYRHEQKILKGGSFSNSLWRPRSYTCGIM